MKDAKKLQNVPTHIEYLKPKDARRNIAWCEYSRHQGRRIYLCENKCSPYHDMECHSCTRCDFYRDKREQDA